MGIRSYVPFVRDAREYIDQDEEADDKRVNDEHADGSTVLFAEQNSKDDGQDGLTNDAHVIHMAENKVENVSVQFRNVVWKYVCYRCHTSTVIQQIVLIHLQRAI